MRQIVVFVPAREHAESLHIARGSGIVGEPKPSKQRVLIYFEGATERPVHMSRFADRVAAAYRQMSAASPTLSKAVLPTSALIAVGTYEPQRREVQLTGRDSEEELARWLRMPQLDPAQLYAH
jgi:hypothetical protein